MSSIGWMNPIPFLIGGETTDIEDVWRAMRGNVGGEHGPGPEDGIEDLGRQVRAERIAFAERAIERAFLQNFPGIATDGLSIWEALTLVSGAENAVALRELVAVAWLPAKGTTTPSLAGALLKISPKLAIDLEPAEAAIVTEPSKFFGPEDNVPPYGLASPVGLVSAVLPNFATADVLRVTYTLEAGELDIPANIARDVQELLHERLPSWQTWTLVQTSPSNGGHFLLDGGVHGESLLDVTSFGG